MIKDANDLLQAWQAEGVSADEQRQRVEVLLREAPTLAEVAAEWAGQQEGPDRDAALRSAFGVIALMGRVERSQYRSRLAKLLGVGIREFNDIAKSAKEERGKAVEKGEAIAILGGFIQGWLIEYLYDPESGEARFAYRDPSGKVGVSDELVIEGKRYVPRPPNSLIRDGGVLFASDLGPLKGTRELTALIERFINEHYLLESGYLAKIISYYVLLTWVYDCFNALPYLRVMGEAGAGKSELMRRVGAICYRMMSASGASTAASFFRATELYRGTVFIDEADLHDGGDMANDLVKFLNLGAMRGNPIWRLEETFAPDGSRSFEPATFQTFCPKLIAMRKDFRDDAVGSRCLTIKLMPREPIELRARGIKLYMDDEFRRKATILRNLLLRWRLHVWQPEIEVGEEFMDLEISSRLNQVTMPLKALARDDPELRDEIERFLRRYNEEMVLSRSMTIAARVVEAMWQIYIFPDLRALYLKAQADGNAEFMMIGDITRIANEIIDEMNATSEEKEEEGEEEKRRFRKEALTARGVGSIIRNELQLLVGQRRGNGYPVFWDEVKMEGLAKRFGVNVEELRAKVNGEGKGREQAKQLEARF